MGNEPQLAELAVAMVLFIVFLMGVGNVILWYYVCVALKEAYQTRRRHQDDWS